MNLSTPTPTNIEQQTQTLINHYQKATLIKPNSAKVYQDIGNLYRSLREFEPATIYYLKAIELKPDLFSVYYPLNFLLQFISWSSEQNKNQILTQGIHLLKQNIIHQPNFPFAHVVLGRLYAQQGEIEKAKDCYQKASFKQINRSYPHLIQHWNSSTQRQPDFLVIGLFKCGTTSFYSYLIQHPQILPAVTKEIRYFSSDFINDLEYYLSHFPAISKNNYLTGEATPNYFTFPNVAQQIKDWFPNIKLILLLRKPIKRAISGFYWGNQFSYRYLNKSLNSIHHLDLNLVQERITEIKEIRKLSFHQPWLSLLAEQSKQNSNINHEIAFHIASSLYIDYLPEWFKVFPKEQLLILKSEDLFTDPEKTMKQAYHFLGLPDHPLTEYRNANRNPYPPISPSLYQQLADFFRPYNQALEDYLGRAFNWE
ncbi:sulfotransferase domain-containing protein [Spirulina sp. CS-785/01]|uniref:sulfotransferase family protein n=1 Tax=Spirulina sp. CS-785/01 TaxID=3021716 RepID=UPI002330FA41|nr:sulfotransferase domain-containing protein [Spirulina sp. CS-785/01]MDB9315585.1 sulfotransferase domain-containing protein [Spirulina sp. CS-785/01]